MYSIEQIASIIQAKASIYNTSAIQYLLTDSRSIVFPEHSLFFALKTSHRNGHDFIQDAYNQGVRNFVVEEGTHISAFDNANFLVTHNTLQALQELAAFHRKQFNYAVVGITGSNGKTIVKEWLYQLLNEKYNIVRSPRSYNSQIGVPLSVWQMSSEYNMAIFEAGISQPGEMQKLYEILQPTIGILTNIGNAHDENFSSREQKIKEKLKLFQQSQIVICNIDDDAVETIIFNSFPNKIFSWGKKQIATLHIHSITTEATQTVVKAEYQNKQLFLTIPFIDEASIHNAITCWCFLLYCKLDMHFIQQHILQLQPVHMRLQLMQGINGCIIINDSYSFDFNSFQVGVNFLLQQNLYSNHYTIILSDFPEHNEHLYIETSALLQAKKIHRIIAIGSYWQQHRSLLKNIAVTEFYTSTEAFLQQFHANQFKNEAILIKGARRFEFEKIVLLLEQKVHQTILEIHLSALTHNLKQFQQLVQRGTRFMAMVKAFAYGSGSPEVARLLQFHKIDYLGVAYVDEGIELRKAGISLPILVFNIDETSFEALINYKLEPQIFSFHLLNAFDHFLNNEGLLQYPIHLKIDSGMHRLGFEQHDMDELCSLLQQNKRMAVKSVLSHLAASEDPKEDAFTQQQVTVFLACCKRIQETLSYTFIKHISNSAAIVRHHEFQFEMVRLGIGLYGVNSSHSPSLSLLPVCILKTTIAQLRKVKAGDTVGYNRKGKVLRNSIIATIRIGYADGFDRRLSNGNGFVFIKGKKAPVIGTVCMDMTMVDVTDIENIKEGDEVEIFGNNIRIEEVAAQCNTIAYEILTGISQRVKRVYIEE